MTNAFDRASTPVPTGALFVAADEPLLIFPSVAAAEVHLEAIDVEDGIYSAAYGPHGEPHRIRSERNRVVIEPTGEANRPDDLRPLLIRYLEAMGRNPARIATFEELVEVAWATDSEFWQEHDPFGDRFAKRIPQWGCMASVFFLVIVLLFVFH